MVDSFGDFVDLRGDRRGLRIGMRACHRPLTGAAKAQSVLLWHSWDTIAERLATTIALVSGGLASENSVRGLVRHCRHLRDRDIS